MAEKSKEIVGQEMKKLKNSLTDIELKQIKAQRDFEDLKPQTPRFKIGLTLDAFRNKIRTHKINVRKIFNYIKQTKLAVERLRFELSSGNITQEIAPGVMMNAEEVQMEIDLKLNLVDRELEQLRNEMWSLAQYVGQHDVLRNMIMSEENYDEYALNVEVELDGLGLKLYAIE